MLAIRSMNGHIVQLEWLIARRSAALIVINIV